MSVRIISAFALTCAMGLGVGCDINKAKDPGAVTKGEIAKAESKLEGERANHMLKGEKLITAGKTQKAKGEALKEQGKTIEGDREIREGELKITQGEAHIKEAEEMKTDVQAGPSSSLRDSGSSIDTEARTASETTTARPAREVDADASVTTDREVNVEARPEATRDREIDVDAAPASSTPDAGAEVDVDVDAQK